MTGTEPHAWETGLMDTITYVGLDVYKATISVALAESGRDGEVRQVGVFENRPEVLSKLVARLSKGGCRLSFCYEDGPCGYGLHRLLTGCGHDCVGRTVRRRTSGRQYTRDEHPPERKQPGAFGAAGTARSAGGSRFLVAGV